MFSQHAVCRLLYHFSHSPVVMWVMWQKKQWLFWVSVARVSSKLPCSCGSMHEWSATCKGYIHGKHLLSCDTQVKCSMSTKLNVFHPRWCNILVTFYTNISVISHLLCCYFLNSILFKNCSQEVIFRHEHTDDSFVNNKRKTLVYTLILCLLINKSNSSVV